MKFTIFVFILLIDSCGSNSSSNNISSDPAKTIEIRTDTSSSTGTSTTTDTSSAYSTQTSTEVSSSTSTTTKTEIGTSDQVNSSSVTETSTHASSFISLDTVLNPVGIFTPNLEKYLGCWTCNKYDSDSVHNEFGTYGSKFSTDSIRNRFGWGSQFKSDGPCNSFASTTPVLIDEQNNDYGDLSINEFDVNSICNKFSMFYAPQSCGILIGYCSN